MLKGSDLELNLFNWNMWKQDTPPIPTPTDNPDLKKLEYILRTWLNSPQRKEQLTSEQYYLGEQDILNKKREVIGEDGKLTPVENAPNNTLVDNVYAKLVNQKTNYVLGKPLTIATSKDEYLKLLQGVVNKRVHRKLRMLAQKAIEGGIAYLYPYYDPNGKFELAVFSASEICPVWRDKNHTELECAMRYYVEEVFTENDGIENIKHVDVFTTVGILHFKLQGGKLIPLEHVHDDYMYVNDEGFNWERLPIIPFKYNSLEIPLIRRVKNLQDAFNEVLSNFKDNMDEDPRTSILLLKNYDGTSIPEFRKNLATYGVVKVTTVDGVQGDLDVIKVDVDASNYQAILQQLKKSIIENGYGFDAKEERLDGDPNEMNINSAYVDIDLDANAMETEFQASFEELRWFIDKYLMHQGKPDYSEEEVEFVFNRDIFINEDAKIDNCVKSVGVISNKTIVARHPWVTNLEHELKQIEEDKQAELDEMEAMTAFQKPQNNKPTQQ